MLGTGGTLLAVVAALLAFWPRRDGRTGFPRDRPARARHALRRPGGRARLRGRVPARRGARRADGRVPAAREARHPRRARGGHRRRGRSDARAARRAAARRARAVVGLRALGARLRERAGGELHVGSRLQPARLAPRRPRAPARQGRHPRVLEGERPRRVRRSDVAAGSAPAHRAAVRAAAGQPREHRALDAGDPCHAAQPAHRHVRDRGDRDRGARRAGLSGRRRDLHVERRARPRRRLRGRRVHAAAQRAPAARGEHDSTRTGCAAT